MTHDMWLAVIGVGALGVAGTIAVGLYAVNKGYTLAVRPAPGKAQKEGAS